MKGGVKMPRLVCEAHNCHYNKNTYCSKGYIDVKGPEAVEKKETECHSFTMRNNPNDMFKAEFATYDTYNQEVSIKCDSVNCSHNRNYICCTGSVKIAGNEASRCSETNCDSFCCK